MQTYNTFTSIYNKIFRRNIICVCNVAYKPKLAYKNSSIRLRKCRVFFLLLFSWCCCCHIIMISFRCTYKAHSIVHREDGNATYGYDRCLLLYLLTQWKLWIIKLLKALWFWFPFEMHVSFSMKHNITQTHHNHYWISFLLCIRN